jgi:pimeloyl-ACP methyl ester carboxylesterase
VPGIGKRILDPDAQREFWYQAFHQLPLAVDLLDGQPGALRDYLNHFWSHWSGPSFTLDAAALDHLVSVYSPLGAFTASIGWYRAGAGSVARSVIEEAPAPGDRIAVPTTVLWPEHDPLFPRAWSDRVDEFFSDATVRNVDGVGHFAPLEYPDDFAQAIREAAGVQTAG